jgi:DNA mismatch repair protein MutL
MEILSRPAADLSGQKLTVGAGAWKGPVAAASPPGTTVLVRDLFFNVPARRKFLRSDDHERRRIQTLVARYAMAYPSVRIVLTMEGRVALRTDGQGDRRQALAAVLGPQVARDMISLPETEARGMRLSGFLSPPSVNRSNRREITVFVNGRWVQDPALGAAVVQAYHGFLMVGRFPMAALFLELPANQVDVNVHPAKSEVRFREAESVFAFVQRAVRAALLRQAPPAAELGPPHGWGPPASSAEHLSWEPAWSMSAEDSERAPARFWEGSEGQTTGFVPLLRAVGQVGASYLVAEGPDGLYLIDQHAAHERVLFEAMVAARADGNAESQVLLEPASVELPGPQAEMIASQLEPLRRIGYEVEAFGGGTFRIRSVPSMFVGLDPAAALRACVEDFEEDESPLAAEVEARLAARVCKRAAIKAGQVLSAAEQQELIRRLEACRMPRTCPHGRPTLIHISVDVLERQFGRRG